MLITQKSATQKKPEGIPGYYCLEWWRKLSAEQYKRRCVYAYSSVCVHLIGHMCFEEYVRSPRWVALFLVCRTIILLRRIVWLIGEVFITHIVVTHFPLNANICCN